MHFCSKNAVNYLEVFVVTLLFIGLDNIVPTLITPTSAFPTAIKKRENDYRDLILSFHEKKTLDLVKNHSQKNSNF